MRENELLSVEDLEVKFFLRKSTVEAVNGVSFGESVEKAAAFVRTCISASIRLGIPEQEGVCFENFLGQLADGGFPSN